MQDRIPFHKPCIIGRELYYVAQSVISGKTAGDGLYTRKCSELLEEWLGADQVLLTTSCTASLEMAALLCEIGEQDEVILPSYTFVSTANAFYRHGAKLVFVDIRPDTLNVDPDRVAEAVTDRTRAIVPVHYAGVGADMDALMAIARGHGIHVVEDAAQGLNAKYKDKYLGTIGDLGAFSFHETKNFNCGEGGALVTNRERFAARAEVIREKGTNRSRFWRGEIDKYTWIDVGSSYLPSDLLAGFLYAQLESMDTITRKRRWIYDRYEERLQRLADRGLLTLPTIPADRECNYHMVYVLLRDAAERAQLIDHLERRNISAVFHYVPLHTSPMGRHLGYAPGMLPVTEDLSERVLRLPVYYEMCEQEIDRVVDGISAFYRLQRASA